MYDLMPGMPTPDYSETFVPPSGCSGDACFATAYNYNQIIYPELTAAQSLALTGVPSSYTLFDAVNNPGASYMVVVMSMTFTYSGFPLHASAQILNAGAAVSGALGTNQILAFPYSVAMIIEAIRYAYDQLQTAMSLDALNAQKTEFEAMSGYRLEDAPDCHCKLIPDPPNMWNEAACMPYAPHPPHVCAC